MFREALPQVTRLAHAIGLDLQGTVVSLDASMIADDRKAIFNRGMVPNINAQSTRRKAPKRGRKPLFDPAIFKERFNTIERVLVGRTSSVACCFGLNA